MTIWILNGHKLGKLTKDSSTDTKTDADKESQRTHYKEPLTVLTLFIVSINI